MRTRPCSLCGEVVEEDVVAVAHFNIWRIPGAMVRIPAHFGYQERVSDKQIDETIHQTMHRIVTKS